MTTGTAVGATAKTALVPATTRPACPFYGFVRMGGILLDCKGNGCGFAGGHHPCTMEMSRMTVNWKNCRRFNHDGNREVIEYALEHCQIFPDELHPPGARKWKGIGLREWYQLIVRE
ncbi:hypothetical protein A3I46_02325 [Candidatus Kaiserbacteria bacterium RIFCSPLOWO2_02_FULL_54_13]|nr:MAG: hypothetical protein UY91_C0009G0004 [Parcubacteria group bacterium GW2011_GWB1_55_9]OGG82465.1 MAG: hypothetical protein A3I46_02325 [Candidatus Kaiserbacteria bacterium RIFCSPLOWO2_02_FULL_54_13]OGG90252.1 MAG: hypothetical protein A3G12_01680 [Candidatus Kaiserbacteria bacterium RIFCSPLOWO2_12_FULL_54_10]